MSWGEVITPGERELFRRCRRAWDLGSARRQNLEPLSAGAPDLAMALREALAVYYYPGMWQLDRALVAVRARQALDFLAQPVAGILYNEVCRPSGGFRRIQVTLSAAERTAASTWSLGRGAAPWPHGR